MKNDVADAARTILVEPMAYQSPKGLFEFFASTPWNFLLHSASEACKIDETNRYSYILVDPFEKYSFILGNHTYDPLQRLRQKITQFPIQTFPLLPPFQGGLAGYLSYDLVHFDQTISRSQHHDQACPDICLGFYDLVCSFDHLEQKAYLISSGYPEQDESRRLIRARKRLDWLKQLLECNKECIPRQNDLEGISPHEISSNFTERQYFSAVRKVIEYIRAGDIFEANLAQRFSAQVPGLSQCGYELYKRLNAINPSPFSAFLNFGRLKIISASPERFVKLHNNLIETRPIKGTCARSSNPVEDALLINTLINSEKNISENIMIVDLMRNDLSIVCEDHSVNVEQLCGHEVYPTVHHLVSVIVGQLKKDMDVFSLLKATFPGGSITGAPKIRAMQIIAELEPHTRGPYCGSIVLVGFDGNMDSSILIRSYVVKDDFVTFHAGGAVVLDSDPMDEYEETMSKSRALKQALCQETYDITN